MGAFGNGIAAGDGVAHWRLDPPVRVGPVHAGANNRSWRVTASGDRYLLKAYRNVAFADRLRFEHALLAALDAAGLPFAVPAPVPAASGATLVPVGGERWALFRHIPGRVARRDDVHDARACGEALAVLHRVLAGLRLPPGISVPDTFVDLEAIHPMVPEPMTALRRALDDREMVDRLAAVAGPTVPRWRRQAAGWGSQIIHGDVYPANALVEGGEVTGLLDFEFAGRGHRAMDVAIGLGAFGTADWGQRMSWSVLEAFATGYLHRWSLAVDEIAAIPLLLLIRELGSLLHWLGRYEAGLTTRGDLHDRTRRLLELDRWLAGNQHRLVRRLGEINGS